tara:strand:- start:224 stop:1429 length:1206 start_codon:yes stop_codon:yes gene_type:complete
MLKKLLIGFLLVLIGGFLGYQTPRGPALYSTLINFGISSNEDYSTLASHQALLDFEELLSAAREMVLNDARTEQEAVEGMRWLLRTVAMSVEVAADANPRRPHFQRMDTLVRKVGGDNPDAEYEFAAIDGQYDYKITGNIGSVRYLGFTFNAGQGTTPRRQFAYLSDQTLELDQDGNFTLILSQEPTDTSGQWIQIPDDASGILVRQYIANRKKEELATLNIDVLGSPIQFSPVTDQEIADAIIGTSYAFLSLTTLHHRVLPELMEKTNVFIKATSDSLGGAISGNDNLYMIGSYQLADDEALIMLVQPPKTRYWNIALESRWHETADYLHRPTSMTLDEVNYNEDGSVEFIVAHKDPGHPNWLDTSGHNFGFITLRWLDALDEDVPMPELEVINWSDLVN